MSYLGRSAKLSLKAQEKVSFLATAGQTSKTGLSYVPNFVEVYVNGILLTDTTDFTATNGNSVTFTVALALNDEVTVISLKTFTVADHYTISAANTLLAAKAPLASPTFTGPTTVNRLSTDGTIVDLQKDGTTVGSVGAENGGMRLNSTQTGRIAYANTNVMFWDDVRLYPNNDNTYNLGLSSKRFKDAYLSGGVYLGGAGSSNKLDDYEEGTFTPTIVFGAVESAGATYNNAYGTYTKIGNRVSYSLYLLLSNKGTSTGQFKIGGFPFTASGGPVGNAYNVCCPSIMKDIYHTGQLSAYQGGGDFALFYSTATSGARTTLTEAYVTNSSEIMLSSTYLTTE